MCRQPTAACLAVENADLEGAADTKEGAMKRLLAVLSTVLAVATTSALAQNYPTRPVTIIVPFAAGGPTDIIARIVGEYFSKSLGQQFIVENVAGAGGTTGITRGAQARPDGYTI